MQKLCECGCGQPAPLARQTNMKRGIVKGQALRFVHGHHARTDAYQDHVQQARTHLRGAGHYKWKGGRFERGDGYVLVRVPDHPHANDQGYALEHIVIASRVLGRPLREDEDVHHINLIRNDNRNANLLICSHSFHAELHARRDCFRAIGTPTTERPCQVCHVLIRPPLTQVLKGEGKYCSIACANTGRSRQEGQFAC